MTDPFADPFPPRPKVRRPTLVHTKLGLEELIEDLKARVDAHHLLSTQAWQIFSFRAFEFIATANPKKELTAVAKMAVDFNRWCGSHPRRAG